jgi:apoptosis-inducing factor 3
MSWIKTTIARSEVPENGVIGAHVGDTPVAFYKLDGQIFATHGVCTHALALLADGWVEDGKIECPLHQGQFDIKSGKALCEPVTQDVPVYPIRVEGDEVYIDLQIGSSDEPG